MENVLGRIDAVMHEQKVDIGHISDQECLVARGHHVTSLLVRAEADLQRSRYQLSTTMFNAASRGAAAS